MSTYNTFVHNVYLASFFLFFLKSWQLSNLLYHLSSLSSAKEFDEAVVAVWFVVLLFEAAFAEGFQAEVAHQMLWMKLGTHCSDTAPQDGLLACLAHSSPGLVVVSFTQGLPLMLKETPVHKWAIAFLQKIRRQLQTKRDQEMISIYYIHTVYRENLYGIKRYINKGRGG